MAEVTVGINTKIPFFLWRLEERKAQLDGNTIVTEKSAKDDETGETVIEKYTNTIQKAPWWIIFIIKYVPIILILLSADWGYYLWNGVGLFFAAAYMLWYFWMTENKPEQFYPVSIALVVALLLVGLFTGKMVYSSHIIANVVYFFLLKLMYDDYMFKVYERYYTIEGKTGMFVYMPVKIKYTAQNSKHIHGFLLGVIAVSLAMIVFNSVVMYKEYRADQERKAYMLQQMKEAEALKKSTKAQLVIEKKHDEGLSPEQIQLRQQLEIGVEQ